MGGKTKTTLKPGDNLPPRGMSNKNRVLDGIRESSRTGLKKDATRDDAEIAFFKKVADRAFDDEDKDSGMLLKFLGDKAWSSMKPTLGNVEFDFDPDSEPHEQASQVMAAAAKGDIAPDVAQMFVASIANMLKINEITEIKERLEALEQMISEGKNG
jgi:hypothetical protein